MLLTAGSASRSPHRGTMGDYVNILTKRSRVIGAAAAEMRWGSTCVSSAEENVFKIEFGALLIREQGSG